MPFTLWVPARRLDNCHCTTRAMMSGRGEAAKIASGSSTEPALALSSVVISICIVLSSGLRRIGERGQRGRILLLGGTRAPHRVTHQHETALGAGHGALDHDQPLHGIDGRDFHVLRGHPLVAEMACHL